MKYEEALVRFKQTGETGFVGTAKEIRNASEKIIQKQDEMTENSVNDELEIHPVFRDILDKDILNNF